MMKAAQEGIEIGTSGGAIVETEEDDGDIGEDEKKMKKALAAAKAKEEELKKGGGNNHDLVSETGINSLGVMPSHMLTGGPAGLGGYSSYLGGGLGGYDYMMRPGMGVGGPSSKIAMLMGFNHLNTIEEEKHET